MPATIAVPAGSIEGRAIVTWPIIVVVVAIIVGPTIVAHGSGVGAWIVRSAVVWLGVVGWTEIIEQKREREWYPETHTLGSSGELGGKDQGADKEGKNQQPFHLG